MKTIVCFGEDWGRHPTTLQFLTKTLAKAYTVIWLESLGFRPPRMNSIDLQRIWIKLRNWWRGPARSSVPGGTVVVYTPLVLPFHGNRWARTLNTLIVRRTVRRLLDRFTDGSAPIIVTASPSTGYLIGHLGERKSVYYCADDYAQMPGVDPVLMRNLEVLLLKRVDAVVATSGSLFKSKRTSGKPIILLRHGVDLQHFSQALSNDTTIHPALHGIQRPIFGFHGLIQPIIDFELIESVARRRPDWSFVFVGSRIGNLDRPTTASNIHFEGPQPYDRIPSVIRAFDVCMIPYRVDQRTLVCNPVKLREYLASGKPVLSTPLPEVLEYSDVVAFATTPDEFISQGEFLLRNNGSSFARQVMNRVQGESWEVVAKKFAEFLESVDQSCPQSSARI